MPNLLDASAPLERYGHNLTSLAKIGTFSPLAGQEATVNRMFQILQRKNKCNPVILGSQEAERWVVVAEAVRRMESVRGKSKRVDSHALASKGMAYEQYLYTMTMCWSNTMKLWVDRAI